ncbi:MAG: efflux RND transporter periplasmic adaptor subunit [Rikenellaceae bacterium]
MRFTNTLFIVVLLLFVGCRGGKRAQTMPPLEVDVAIAKVDSLYDKITFATTLEPLYEAVIEPRVSGYLQSIIYDDGMPIKRGSTIFIIDPIEYQTALSSAQADYSSAQADLALAKSNYDRAVPLAAIDAISQMDLEQYKNSYQSALSSVEYMRQGVESNRLNLGYTKIKAPIDGIIARTSAKEGDFVGVGTTFSTLTTIKYTDTLTLSLPIAQSRYLKYTHGDSFDNAHLLSDIEITLPDGSLYPLRAHYYYTKQSGSDNTSTVVLVARVANDNERLKSGMFVRVRADIGEAKSVVVIPQQAVNQSQGVSSVWVVKSDSSVVQRAVKLGATYGDMWSVESGVNRGDMVLTTGALKVRDGSRVNPKVVR